MNEVVQVDARIAAIAGAAFAGVLVAGALGATRGGDDDATDGTAVSVANALSGSTLSDGSQAGTFVLEPAVSLQDGEETEWEEGRHEDDDDGHEHEWEEHDDHDGDDDHDDDHEWEEHEGDEARSFLERVLKGEHERR
jgi:hypothetical protein